jgi:adenine-specific DNA-methyltransferase
MNFIARESAQKLRGGYYTPLDLATFITRWLMAIGPQTILEPSCGDGVFIDALRNAGSPTLPFFFGFEQDGGEAQTARSRATKNPAVAADIQAADFLDRAITLMGCDTPRFDAVAGNPPFIRYQYLPEASQRKAETIFRMLHLPFTRHTNAWVPFVLASLTLLKPGGRLGMIVPAEIIHVVHARGLRTYLGETCRRLLIVDPTDIWFPETLQGAVILFAEKKADPAGYGEGLGILKVTGRSFLQDDPSTLFDGAARLNDRSLAEKWTRALLDERERSLLHDLGEHPAVRRFADIASVDVGIVTGANHFFLVPDGTVAQYGLQRWAHPMFGRSSHVAGLVYSREDHENNRRAGRPANFLRFRQDDLDGMSTDAKRYLDMGAAEGLPGRFKCRSRRCWFEVPSVYAAPVAMLKRAHNYPRLVLNAAGAYTTDTAYRIQAMSVSPEALVLGFVNSLTALTAEIEGRHYGGGVLELVPSEIERLLVPAAPADTEALAEADRRFRTSDDEIEFLAAQDNLTLHRIGLTRNDADCLHAAWLKLRNRRHRLA